MKKTRRNVWCNGILCLLAAGMLMTGCRKSEAEQAAEYYQEEYGMSEETAEQLADSFFGEETNETEAVEDGVVENEFKIYEPLPEIVNSKLGDGLVQIHDVIIYENGTMTVKEVMEALSQGAEADNYNYKINREEMKKDSLVAPQSRANPYIEICYGPYQSFDSCICELNFENPTNDYLNIEDCVVTFVRAAPCKGMENLQRLNVYFAGNLNLSISSELTEDFKYYDELSDYILTYDNIAEYMAEQGYDKDKLMPSPASIIDNKGDRIITKGIATGLQEEKACCYYIYDFRLNMENRRIEIDKQTKYAAVGASRGPIDCADQASEAEWEQLCTDAKGSIAGEFGVDAASLECVGRSICYDEYFKNLIFYLYKGKEGQYYLSRILYLEMGMENELYRENVSFCNSSHGTYEEAMDEYDRWVSLPEDIKEKTF